LDVQDGKAVYNEKMKPEIQLVLLSMLPGTEPEPLKQRMMKVSGYTDEQV